MPATHYYPVVGGIETWTRNIAEQLAKKAEVFVVTGKVHPVKSREAGIPQNAELFNGVKIFRTSLFPLNNLSHSPLIYILSSLPFIFLKSLALVKKEKINIVHCQGFLSSFLGFCLSKITGVPYIVTVQRLESKRNPVKNFIYRNAAVCIGASRAVAENFRKIGCRNVEVIPNGIDLHRFINLGRKPHAGFVVMTVARLEKVKGIDYLIKAITNLQFTNFQLLIIGDGSERRNLENLTEKLGLRERVKFLGEIPNERVPEYLAAADCFVLPSLKEGFGIVILEAQAAGIPVIGTRVGGILDLIENGKTGLLVEPADSQAIAEAIEKIYSGFKFPQINLEKYNWQSIADKVYETYFRYGHISS